MAFTRWRKNKQIVIDDVQEQDPAMSRNAVQQSHPDHQVNNGSTGSGSVIAQRPTFINNRFRFFGRRGSCSNSTTTTQKNEDEPIDSDVDCTLRLGCPTEPPSKPQQQQVQQVYPQGGDGNLSAVIDNYFPPNNVDPQELMQNYEVMDGRRTDPIYPQHSQHHNIDNRFGMNNFNQNNYQLQQQIMNNNMIVDANHGGGSPSLMNVGGTGNINNIDTNMSVNNNMMFHTGGSPSTMNVVGNCNNSLIADNHGMFHGGGSPSIINVGGNNNRNNSNTFIVNNNGMFHGGGSPSAINVGGVNNSNLNNNHLLVNNHGMFHGGGSPSTMNGYTNNNHMIVNDHGMHGGGSPGMFHGGVGVGQNNMVVNNNGMFHGGVSQTNMVVNNNGMFHGGDRSFTMNSGSNSSNNFGMLHGGRGGGCDLSSVVVALPSPGVGPVGDGFNSYNIPYPLPPQPPNNFHVPFLNNNIPSPFPAPQLLPPAAPAVFLAAPRRDEPYHHNYPPQPQPVKRCFACKTLNTPLWRNGPKGPKSLCNACGIRYKKEVRRIMGVMAPDGGQQGDKRGKF